jgi:glucokinase
MEPSTKYILAGDLGGTQVRLSLFDVNKSRHEPVYEYFGKTMESTTLEDEILKALAGAPPDSVIEAAVFGIAGPVDESRGEVLVMVDVPQWGRISEKSIQDKTGIKRCKLLNDFVANGYGISALKLDDPTDAIKVYEPANHNTGNVVLVYGIGTGLGVCILARPSEDLPYQAYPSEAGIVKMEYFNKADREYRRFLIERGYSRDREDISLVLGGPFIPYIAEFLATT